MTICWLAPCHWKSFLVLSPPWMNCELHTCYWHIELLHSRAAVSGITHAETCLRGKKNILRQRLNIPYRNVAHNDLDGTTRKSVTRGICIILWFCIFFYTYKPNVCLHKLRIGILAVTAVVHDMPKTSNWVQGHDSVLFQAYFWKWMNKIISQFHMLKSFFFSLSFCVFPIFPFCLWSICLHSTQKQGCVPQVTSCAEIGTRGMALAVNQSWRVCRSSWLRAPLVFP